MRILIYCTYQPALDTAKASIASFHSKALANVIFENDPKVVVRRLAGLSGSEEPFVLVCGNRLSPRIMGHADGGALAKELKRLNAKTYVVVLSPSPEGAEGADELIERKTPEETDLYRRLALLAMESVAPLMLTRPSRRPPAA